MKQIKRKSVIRLNQDADRALNKVIQSEPEEAWRILTDIDAEIASMVEPWNIGKERDWKILASTLRHLLNVAVHKAKQIITEDLTSLAQPSDEQEIRDRWHNAIHDMQAWMDFITELIDLRFKVEEIVD